MTTYDGSTMPLRLMPAPEQERFIGGGGGDKIIGTDRGDYFEGGGGNDTILCYGGDDLVFGGDGADKIIAGVGQDTIVGGTGRDTMYGGSGGDIFVFGSAADSGTSADTRDVIFDFSAAAGDRISLADFAGLSSTGTEVFEFVGQAAFSGAGQIRYEYDAALRGCVVYGNIDGDTAPDFAIMVNRVTQLSASDFIL